jgi:multiple sugar transport system permease protein
MLQNALEPRPNGFRCEPRIAARGCSMTDRPHLIGFNTKGLKWPSRRRLSEILFAYSVTLPAILIILLTVIYPVYYLFQLSLSEVRFDQGVLNPVFIGLQNFSALLSDPSFINSTRRTLTFTLFTVPISLVLGMAVALAMNNIRRGSTIVRMGVLLPWLVPGVVAGLIWRWMLHDQIGLVNWLLMSTGIMAQKQAWLAEVATAMPSVIWVDIWANTPMVAIILLAGLQIISEELYDAATVDGASVIQRFRYVTLPLLRPQILIALLLRTMFSLRAFDIVVMLSGSKYGSSSGNPAGTTQVYSLLIWQRAIENLRFGSSAAIAVVVFTVTMIISIAYVAVLRSESAAE